MTITLHQSQAAEAVQHAAAHAPQQQVRLVAGPGTGKSQTIQERVRGLLANGIPANQIAVVSFTNASAIDLRVRLRAYCHQHNLPQIDEVSITTLHSLALRMLRQAGLLQMYPTRPLVLDNWELENIYDAEFGQSQGIASRPRRAEIRRFYEAFWSTGQENAATYVPPDPPITDDKRARFNAFHGPTSQVYSCVLPGEIVRNCVRAAASGQIDPAVVLHIQHLIVDEYQDLNPADLDFVDRLAAAGVVVFVAGDDDQSIYSFRHASPLGIQRFGAKYPNAALPVLSECFRCTPSILEAATRVILNNQPPDRIAKQIVSLHANGQPPNPGVMLRWRFVSAYAEADAIAHSCRALIDAGAQPNGILVLLVSRDTRIVLWPAIRDALTAAGVPFDPPKEEGFADSDAGRLVLALLRIIASRDNDNRPEDLVAHRILLGLRDGIGVGTCDRIRAAVLNTPNTSYRGLFYDPLPEGVFSGRLLTALNGAREVCAQIAQWGPDDRLGDRRFAITAIVRGALGDDATAAWHQFADPLVGDMSLAELRDYLWVDNAQQRADVMGAVRQRLGLPDEPADQDALNRVRVMTMHGAKGLSARVVFIPALEEGLLPNQYQMPYAAQVMEAARLAYVSITRARAACIVSFATRRRVFGDNRNQVASRFAIQTGGAFVARDGGLTDAEIAAILDAIGNL